MKTELKTRIANTVIGYAYRDERRKLRFSESPVKLTEKEYRRIAAACDRRNLSILTPPVS
jgi:hypothetical protein